MKGMSFLHALLRILLKSTNKSSSTTAKKGTKKNWKQFFMKSIPRSNLLKTGMISYISPWEKIDLSMSSLKGLYRMEGFRKSEKLAKNMCKLRGL